MHKYLARVYKKNAENKIQAHLGVKCLVLFNATEPLNIQPCNVIAVIVGSLLKSQPDALRAERTSNSNEERSKKEKNKN